MRHDDPRPVRNPDPLPEATLADVKLTLEGLVPGTYTARDLYARYAERKKAQGQEPDTPTALGRMFREFGLISKTKKGARAWLVQ